MEKFRGRVNAQNQTLSFSGRPEFLLLWSPQESLEPDCRSGGSFHQPRPMDDYNEVYYVVYLVKIPILGKGLALSLQETVG